MFNAHANTRNTAVFCFLPCGERFATRFLFGLNDTNPLQRKSLKSRILIERTPLWHRIRFFIRNSFVMAASRPGFREKPHFASGIAEEVVLLRMSLFLSAITRLLQGRIRWAPDRTFCGIMEKYGLRLRLKRQFSGIAYR